MLDSSGSAGTTSHSAAKVPTALDVKLERKITAVIGELPKSNGRSFPFPSINGLPKRYNHRGATDHLGPERVFFPIREKRAQPSNAVGREGQGHCQYGRGGFMCSQHAFEDVSDERWLA